MPDQKKYVDLASEMGFDYILVDAGWDQNLGYDGAEELVRYAAAKNVDVFLCTAQADGGMISYRVLSM